MTLRLVSAVAVERAGRRAVGAGLLLLIVTFGVVGAWADEQQDP
jgi:hypothetical protein